MNDIFELFVKGYLYFACAVWGFWLYVFAKLGFYKFKAFLKRR
jgi:hypothetical protein